MRTLWCWRCKRDVPVLDEAEFEGVGARASVHDLLVRMVATIDAELALSGVLP